MSNEPASPAAITPADWKHLVPAILAECCYSDSLRFPLDRPFVVGDHLYATDGRIAARIPTPEGWAIPNPSRFPASIAGMFDEFRASRRPEPTPIPTVEAPCPACKGAMELPERDCPECRGEGREDVTDECDCPHCWGYHECGECSGSGKIPAGRCKACEGSGVEDPGEPVEVTPGYWLRRGYLVRLLRPGPTLYLPVELETPPGVANDYHPCWFVTGEVEGALCAMTDRDDL